MRQDLADFARTRVSPSPVELSDRQREVLARLRRDGYAVIEGYWPREQAIEIRDRLDPQMSSTVNRDYESGAYLRVQDHLEYDQGVRRLFHVERELAELGEFRRDPFVLGLAEAYYRTPFHSSLLMCQFNLQSNHETRYFHVDSFAKEMKAFLYLDDVDSGNGPFTYIRRSHRNHLVRVRKQLSGNVNGAATSFAPEEIEPLLDREDQLTGPAGTLLIADVRGLHRGAPQLDRSRMVLVNYLTRHQGDAFPAR